MAVGFVIYSKARAFKAKAKSSRPRPENRRPRPRNLALRPRARINIPAYRRMPITNFRQCELQTILHVMHGIMKTVKPNKL